MPEEKRSYIAIDLKSFYASVECAALGLDPLTTNLVVADLSRTEKTICLAVSPSLKAYGISGRARLFEVVQRVKQVNSERLKNAPDHRFTGKSSNAADLASDSSLELDYIAAKPQMARYMRISTEIFGIYMKYQHDIILDEQEIKKRTDCSIVYFLTVSRINVTPFDVDAVFLLQECTG